MYIYMYKNRECVWGGCAAPVRPTHYWQRLAHPVVRRLDEWGGGTVRVVVQMPLAPW